MIFVRDITINRCRTPEVLRLLSYKPTARCALCFEEICSLHHILTNCTKSLVQGRYTWRHDSVLYFLRPLLTELISSLNSVRRQTQGVERGHRKAFVKAGPQSCPVKRVSHTGLSSLLAGATDWQLLIEIGSKKIVFPPEIYSTPERPDIVLWSKSLHKVVLVELTCPAEEGIAAACLTKLARYETLTCAINNDKSSPWNAELLTIESGVCGSVALSMLSFLRKMGLSSTKARAACKIISTITAKCSFTIFLSRETELWNCKRDLLTIEEVHSSPWLPESVGSSASAPGTC